jgi:hypothetical protein
MKIIQPNVQKYEQYSSLTTFHGILSCFLALIVTPKDIYMRLKQLKHESYHTLPSELRM